MKTKLIAAAALLAVLSSCNVREQRYTVQGNVADSLATLPGSIVYLLDSDGPVDSCRVSDASFTFKGVQDKTKELVAMLRFPGRDRYESRFIASFVPDASRINIDLDYPATVTGSPLTDAMEAFREQVMNLYYEHQTDVGSLSMNGDQEAADSIMAAQMRKIQDLCRQTYSANTDNILGLQALTQLGEDAGSAELEALVAEGSDFIREDESIRRMLEAKRNAEATAVGAKFVDIKGKAADSSAVSLSDFAGKGSWVLADFWASWCGPCMMALPHIREIRDNYADKGLVVVGINVWERNPEDGPEAAVEKEMDWNLIFTSGSDATAAYGIEGIPTLILFAPDGTIAERLLGEEGLAEAISKHLD